MVNYVIDACIFNKLYLDEEDRKQALEFFKFINSEEIKCLAPYIFDYEVLAVALHYNVPFADVLALLNAQKEHILKLTELDTKEILLAENISKDGDNKRGYPQISDAFYHSIAINRKHIFITADKKYFLKTEKYGSISLLENWKDFR